MKKETNFETSPLNTQDAKAEAATTLAPDATNGDKIKALRTAQHMSMAELARRASMSDRAIRYIESNQREPSVDAIQKIAAALGVTTDYFMDEATFQQELNDDLFYADVRKKYGSRGVAQAKKIKEQTTALFAGGELSEEDQAAFIKEMEALFLDAKANAKKFTPEERGQTLNTRIIDTADAVVRRYKPRNPEEIISQRAIKLKDIRHYRDLLGYYTVMLNCEYIGINPNCTTAQRISALAHELGHALFDRKHASSGQAFQDTYFYSLDNSKAERRANIFASELLLSDDDILKPIGYYEFNADRIHLETNMPSHASAAYRAMKYQELLQEFLYTHGDVLTPAEIAQKIKIEKHFVDFKLNILAAKGYQLPVLPELHNDFLKDSMKNSEVK